MARYIHQHEDWPNFRWDNDAISHELAAVRHRQGRLLGRMESLGFDFRSEAVLQTLTEDVIKSNEIEGAFLIAGKEIHRLYHSKRLAVGQGPSGSFGVRAVKDQTKVKKKALNVSVA